MDECTSALRPEVSDCSTGVQRTRMAFQSPGLLQVTRSLPSSLSSVVGNCLFVIGAVLPLAFAQSVSRDVGQIKGCVRTVQGHVLAGVTVNAKEEGGKESETTKTDAD